MSDINLGKGDTEDKNCILTLNGVGIDLTQYTSIVFRFKAKNNSSNRVSINCVDGVKTLPANGGTIIPFDATHTKSAGEYEGQFIITDLNGKSLTIPLGTKVSITIYDSI